MSSGTDIKTSSMQGTHQFVILQIPVDEGNPLMAAPDLHGIKCVILLMPEKSDLDFIRHFTVLSVRGFKF